MNTHKILRESEFGAHPKFGEIAQWASKQKFKTEEEMMVAVRANFKPPERQELNEAHAPYTIFSPPEIRIESETFEQINKVLRIPSAVSGALLPDNAPGYGMPIGGVAAYKDAISASAVGMDISCQVRASFYKINPEILDSKETRENILKLVIGSTSFGVGASTKGLDHPVMSDPRWDSTGLLRHLKPLAQEQLGSSGGGNHFADVMKVHFEDGTDCIALVTHSGSRGSGAQIAQYFIKKADEQTAEHYRGVQRGYGWLRPDSELGIQYWDAMSLMGDYADANHDEIHRRFSKLLGEQPFRTEGNKHNFAWKEMINGEELYVHRKGATPAHLGQIGIIPGSSGTPTYFVVGVGNPLSLESTSHGAGRPFSRTAAKQAYDPYAFKKHMDEMNITFYGIAPDETWMAYKDIEQVMAAQSMLATIIAKGTPSIVVMGGASDDGD